CLSFAPVMQVHRSLSQLPAFRNAVLTIGTFDGVHLGHQKIIQQLVQSAREVNGESVLISFDPHPRKIISSVPGDIRLLTLL
ncbi:adenylyltransferase/cytidyltransferase family protein, partial [Klebsiella pneumoniae]